MEAAVRRINEVRCMAIIGAGTMGQGIAADLLAKSDWHLILMDVGPEALNKAKVRLEEQWQATQRTDNQSAATSEALSTRVTFTSDEKELRRADIIWEVATEQRPIKAKIFANIEKFADIDRLAAVFSNTSSYTTEELAGLFQSAILRERFLTVHGYYPFDRNRLIDVMKGKFASRETFTLGIIFAEQILEKTVIALPLDHHGYITDPIFQAMAAIISWDVRSGKDMVQLGGVWELFTANPFSVLDQTGHMPYLESAHHFGEALPVQDRLRSVYHRQGKFYPEWIGELDRQRHHGVRVPARRGFFEWDEEGKSRRGVYDPVSGEYAAIEEISRRDYWSYYEAAEHDRRMGKVKSAEGIVHVACANDAGGRAFRRYVLPVCLYVLDLIQDGIATAGQVNIATRVGLRFKTGLVEAIDALMARLTVEGLIELVRRAADENADDLFIVEMLDVDGAIGPRKGRRGLLHELNRRNVSQLLSYGAYYHTPVAELDLDTGTYVGCYPDLKLREPSARDRVAAVVFHNPMRGNVWNRANIDQLAHAYARILRWHREGRCGAVLFTAGGMGMRMLGADAREFNRGWFDPAKGYSPLTEEEAAASSRNAVRVFRTIQRSPVASIGVFGEKWGGGAEFTYFLDLRYDLRSWGSTFDSLDRVVKWEQKCVYNQPELDYAILPGFGAVGELKRLGLGDSAIFELFDQGMTADRALQVGLSNAVFDDELEALRRGFERARLMAKDAPFSRALFKHELHRGADDEALARETGETFNPRKNPYIQTGLLALLDRRAKAPPMDRSCRGVHLPGWDYPEEAQGDEPGRANGLGHGATPSGGVA